MKKRILAVSVLSMLVLASCSAKEQSSKQSSTPVTTAAETTTAAATEAVTETTAESTTEHVTASQNEVGFEGMTEVKANTVKDGEYHISVDSSSSMFKIADCILYVKGNSMNADIIIDSKSYDALFMGTEDEAKNAAESERITYTANDSGQSVFNVPVEALDKEIQCAALSAKKQEWYGRTLVFRADSLPDEALLTGRYTECSNLGLEDGEYTVDVTLEGGSGRASVASPAKLIVKDGMPDAEIVWSSDKYDKMVMQGATYLPTITDGHSVFTIDVLGFDYKMPVGAETTAMSEPHMIDYTLYFDSSTIKKCE